jgi:hypothetical protein
MGAPDPRQIERLQAQAARNPAFYRWRVGAIAVAGDVALTVIQILPIALPIFIGLMFYNFPYKFWLFAAVVAFLAWVIRPSFRFHGREVTLCSHPWHEPIVRLELLPAHHAPLLRS